MSEEEEEKVWWKKALNKTQDVIADPKTVKVSKVANKALQLASYIGQAKLGGPVAAAGAVLGSVDIIVDAFDISRSTPIRDYIDNHGLALVPSALGEILRKKGVLDEAGYARVVETKDSILLRKNFGEEFAVFQCAHTNGNVNTVQSLYTTPNLDLKHLAEPLWKSVGGHIAQVSASGYRTENVDVIACPIREAPYTGDKDPKKFADEIEVYRSKGISRAALLYGPPGTGKTTYILAYANLTRRRVLIVPPDALSKLDVGQLALLVGAMRPDVVLFDDLERTWNGTDKVLNVVENIRATAHDMLVVATCNDFSKLGLAMTRPGRLGVIMEFGTPTLEEKYALVDMYMARYGVDKDRFNIKELVEAMDHDQFSHDYVRFVCEEAVILDHERLLKRIGRMIQHLNMIPKNKMDYPDDDF